MAKLKPRYEVRLECGYRQDGAASVHLWTFIGVLIGAVLGLCQVVHAASPEVDVLAELRVPIAEHGPSFQYVPADKFVQGQEIFYTVRIQNSTEKSMSGVQVIQVVPANTRYVQRSATGAGAQISCSYDGGKTFITETPSPINQNGVCTHLRWDLPYPLASKAVLLARFRVVFQ